MRKITISIYISIFCLFAGTSYAASMYVTDRILLGVHAQPSEASPIIQSIPSGTAVEVIQNQGDFTKIKLISGTQGWVSNKYLMSEQPSTAQYDKLFAENQKNLETLKKLNTTLSKRERDVQIYRDELSNAKHAIKELKKSGKTATTTTTVADPAQATKLAEAEAKISELTKQLDEMKSASSSAESNTDSTEEDAKISLKYAEEENAALQARIALALSNLSGEKAPTPEELAGIRPRFPLWYWLLMVIALAVGVGGGVMWMDHQARKRHGGFRV